MHLPDLRRIPREVVGGKYLILPSQRIVSPLLDQTSPPVIIHHRVQIARYCSATVQFRRQRSCEQPFDSHCPELIISRYFFVSSRSSRRDAIGTDKVIAVIIIHTQYRRGSQGDLGGKRISFQVIGLTRSLEPGSLYYDVLQRVSRIIQCILAGPRQDDPSKSVRYTEGPFPFGPLFAVL